MELWTEGEKVLTVTVLSSLLRLCRLDYHGTELVSDVASCRSEWTLAKFYHLLTAFIGEFLVPVTAKQSMSVIRTNIEKQQFHGEKPLRGPKHLCKHHHFGSSRTLWENQHLHILSTRADRQKHFLWLVPTRHGLIILYGFHQKISQTWVRLMKLKATCDKKSHEPEISQWISELNMKQWIVKFHHRTMKFTW